MFDTSATAFALPLRDLSIRRPARLRRRQQLLQRQLGHRAGVDRRAATASARPSTPSRARRATSRTVGPSRRTSADDPELGLLLRLSVPGPDGTPQPVPGVRRPAPGSGDQRRAGRGHDRASPTTEVAGHLRRRHALHAAGAHATRSSTRPSARSPPDLQISPRIAPPVFGVGLLEAVPEDDGRSAGADPDDADGDGISGRPNRVVDVATGGTSLGRFGWKANVPTVEQQIAGAFHGDIGITTLAVPGRRTARPSRPPASPRPTAATPEVDDAKLDRVTFYTRTLAVPARRDVGSPRHDRGRAGCSPSWAARRATVRELTTGDVRRRRARATR